MAEWIVLGVVGLIILRGVMKGVDVYGAFLAGGKQGMKSALGLLPALCAMMFLLGVMNASGLNELLATALSPVLRILNLPQETSTVLLMRPLSGSGSMAALQQVFDQCGVDSRAGKIASVLMSASETIFYTMTVYLGATGIRRLPGVIGVSLVSYLIGAAVCGWMV